MFPGKQGKVFLGKAIVKLTAALFAVGFMANAAQADSVGLGVGVHGVALDYRWDLTPHLDVRFALTDMPFTDSLEVDGIEYDLEYDRTNLAVIVDVAPWANDFYFSAGLFVLEHDWLIDSGSLNGNYIIGGDAYEVQNLTLGGEVSYSAATPYLGLGWKNIFGQDSAWAMTIDAGFIYVGEPTVDYDASGQIYDSSQGGFIDVEGSSEFQAAKDREEEELEDKLSDYEFWPVLQLGVTYSF